MLSVSRLRLFGAFSATAGRLAGAGVGASEGPIVGETAAAAGAVVKPPKIRPRKQKDVSAINNLNLPPATLEERRHYLRNTYEFSRPEHYSTFYDFDAWVYGLQWPQQPAVLPMMNRLSVAVDDIKFASNAWSLLRVCAFYGLPHPRVLSDLSKTTPSMANNIRGNWKFYEHCTVSSSLNPKAAKVALMPSHPRSVLLHDCDWSYLANTVSQDGTVEIVLGMENGMRQDVCDSCDAWLSIPQYGSCGSLSMLNALGIVMHSASSVLHPKAAQRRLFVGSSFAKQELERKAVRRAIAEEEKESKAAEKETLVVEGSNAASSSSSSSSTVQQQSQRASGGSAPPPPNKILHEGLHHSSAVGHTYTDAEIEWLSTAKKDFAVSRPHGDELLGLDDAAISRLLADRRKHLPLQLATFHHNETGDRNIGAIVRNGNIYNFEKMIIVGRKKFSRRGTVGTHNYTNICYHDDFETAFEKDCEGYALWVLHNPFAYLCNRTDEILPNWQLPKQLSVGKKAAKDMPGSFMPYGHPMLQQWLAADEKVPLIDYAEPNTGFGYVAGGKRYSSLSSGGAFVDCQTADAPAPISVEDLRPIPISDTSPAALAALPQREQDRVARLKALMGTLRYRSANGQQQQGDATATREEDEDSQQRKGNVGEWERNHPMYGVVADQLRPSVFLDDEVSLLEAVADVKRRGLRGIMLAVPEEGSTPVWPMMDKCERIVSIVHPHRSCGSVQRGLTSAVSTAIALERLREATLMLQKDV